MYRISLAVQFNPPFVLDIFYDFFVVYTESGIISSRDSGVFFVNYPMFQHYLYYNPSDGLLSEGA